MRSFLLAVVVALSACGLPTDSDLVEPTPRASAPIESGQVLPVASVRPDVIATFKLSPYTLAARSARTFIRLEQREGLSTTGLAFAPQVGTVDQASAAILVSSFDCGARGRWVDLVAGSAFSFCARSGAYPEETSCEWVNSIPIGGSDADGAGLSFLVRRGEEVIGRFQVVEVTPTPFEWYQTEAPFDVFVDAYAQ